MVCPTWEKKLSLVCDAGFTNARSSQIEAGKVLEEAIEEILEVFTLPICVILRVLTKHKREELLEGEWLGSNIFHT